MVVQGGNKREASKWYDYDKFVMFMTCNVWDEKEQGESGGMLVEGVQISKY